MNYVAFPATNNLDMIRAARHYLAAGNDVLLTAGGENDRLHQRADRICRGWTSLKEAEVSSGVFLVFGRVGALLYRSHARL